jgi:hypothetical protein
MKIVHIFFSIIIIILLLLTASCSTKRDALGSPDKIIVVADSTQWLDIEDDVRAAMEKIIYSPQPEPTFSILQKNPDQLGKLQRFPNLLFVGTLDADNDMRQLFETVLTDDARARVEQDSAFLFNKQDPWARHQLLGLVVSKDISTLKKNLQSQGEQLFNLYDEQVSANMFRQLFEHFEQKEISKSLMAKHGWNIRVQHDYHVAVDSSDLRTVWLRRFNPQRWISVYWEPVDDPSILSKEWMLSRRDEIIHPLYDGDYIYEDDVIKTQEKVVNFNERYAIRLDGVWQNDKHVMGGPFRSFAFYDENDGRLYLIDLAVFAPGRRKYQYLRQMEGIVSTFKTKLEI